MITQIPDSELRTRAFGAFCKVDSCIPVIALAMERMGDTEEAKLIYTAQVALQSAADDLRGL